MIVEQISITMTPLPTIPEAVIPGTPFGIEVLKAVLAMGCVLSLIGSIPGLLFHFVANHSSFRLLISLGYAVLFGIGFYGIHRRMGLAWTVGWFYLGIAYVSSIVSVITTSETTPDRWIMLCIVVVGFSAVGVYWGVWWEKQKLYFKT